MNSVDPELIQWPQSIRGINELNRDIKEALYLSMLPDGLLDRFAISPTDRDRVRIVCPADTRSVEVSIYHHKTAHDPIMYVHLADTLNYQIAILLVVVNDPASPRFNIDITENGLPTRFGTDRRNIPEEIRAMEAGLAPGQVRAGLRLTRPAISTFERFITRTGHDMVILEPLTYSNAIIYERYGFAYFQGRKRVEWIDEVLRPSGPLFDRFDDSTPFRRKDAWKSVRGRAWAIHDGILDEPFGDIRMYKRVGHHAGINTFADAVW